MAVKTVTISGTDTESDECYAAGAGLAGLWFRGSAGATDPGAVTILGAPLEETDFVAHGAAVTGPTSVAGALTYIELPADRFHALQRFKVSVATAPGAGESLTITPNFF
jgi:hypothetical protein